MPQRRLLVSAFLSLLFLLCPSSAPRVMEEGGVREGRLVQDVRGGGSTLPHCHVGDVPQGPRPDHGFVSVIMLFLRLSFGFGVLPTVFLKRLSFPSAGLCGNWPPGSSSPRRDGPPRCSASWCWVSQPCCSRLCLGEESGSISGL